MKVRSLSKFSANDEMYEDETGSQKGELQNGKIVKTKKFSVNAFIRLISGIIAIM